MRVARFVLPAVILALASACNPEAVDPDAEFEISGTLINLDGSVAANTRVRVYKVDSMWNKESNFLQFTSLRDSELNPSAIYTTETNVDGRFTMVLQGHEVNTDGGTGAAYLSVVFFEDGVEDTYLVTATDWYFFTNTNPIWNIGDLKLWNGGTASQTGDMITIDWSASPAPDGHSRVAGLPTFLFAWDSGSPEALPKWAEHTVQTKVIAPRAVFANRADSPEYFLTSFSQPNGGSQVYQHRTSLHTADSGQGVLGWTGTGEGVDLALVGSLFQGSETTPFTNNSASDGDIDTWHEFVGINIHAIYIDLGGYEAFSHVLLYNLGIVNFQNAVITLETCPNSVVSSGCWSSFGATIQGDWEYENWVYAADSQGGSANWIRVNVDRAGNSGAIPYFDFVSEVRVVQ